MSEYSEYKSPFQRVDHETGKAFDQAEEAALLAKAAQQQKQPVKAVPTPPQKDNPTKDYLICLKLDNIGDNPMVHEIDTNRFIEAQSRSEAYEKIKNVLMDFDYELNGYIRLDDSFVIVEDVTLKQKVSLFRFLELCLVKHGRNTASDQFIASTLKEFLEEDDEINYDTSSEEEQVYATPQIPNQYQYGNVIGEDIN